MIFCKADCAFNSRDAWNTTTAAWNALRSFFWKMGFASKSVIALTSCLINARCVLLGTGWGMIQGTFRESLDILLFFKIFVRKSHIVWGVIGLLNPALCVKVAFIFKMSFAFKRIHQNWHIAWFSMNPMVNACNVRICFSLQVAGAFRSENLLIANETMESGIFANSARLMGLNLKIILA